MLSLGVGGSTYSMRNKILEVHSTKQWREIIRLEKLTSLLLTTIGGIQFSCFFFTLVT